MQDTSFQLGVKLVKREVIAFDVLEKALKIRKDEPVGAQRNLAQILVTDLKCDYDSIFKEVSSLYGFEKIVLSEEDFTKERVDFVNGVMQPLPENLRKLMEREKIAVYRREEVSPHKYIIASVDPTSRYIPAIARALNAKRYEVRYISPADYVKFNETVSPRQNEFLKQLDDSAIEMEDEDLQTEAIEEADIDAEINQSMLVNLVEGMLVEAVRRGVSDIHVIPRDTRTTDILFRVDGKLQVWHTQRGSRPEAVSAVIKDRSQNIDRFERESPQDGFIQRTIDDHMIRYRVSVIPIVGRQFEFKLESIVIRILDDRNVITDLDKLGFHGTAREAFVKAISKPQGMIILTGPTGSGKSTTLVAALSHVLSPEINVLTVEDPVEYILSGVRQLKISPKNTFENAIRAILRHDPDVVMVGEIRDKQTADIGIKLANTGHLTFSTLHTNDAPSAISRLFKMGVEPFLIAYAINIVIAQRLIRRLCKHCKQPMQNLDPTIPRNLGFSDEEISKAVFYEPKGCAKCRKGYKGRVAIHEALYFSKDIRTLIFESGDNIDEEKLRQLAIKEGMMTLRDAARTRVLEGTTSFEEMASATSED